MKIRLRHLRYTVAAAEHGSFRRAAERLRVQESAISRGVGEVEGIVGAPLFYRSTKGVRLTPAGSLFVSTSGDLLQRLSWLVREAGQVAGPNDRKLRLGLACPMQLGGFAQVLEACLRQHTDIVLEAYEASRDDLILKLRDKELDAVFCAGAPPDGLQNHRIANEQLMLVARQDALNGTDYSVSWEELSRHDLTFDQSPLGAFLQEFCARRLVETAAAPEILPVQPDTLLRLIATNGGATILPATLTKGLPAALSARPIRNAQIGIFLIWRSGRYSAGLRMLLVCAGVARRE